MAFDRDLLVNNISHLINKKGVKIGEIESSADVVAGYFSRLKKSENKKCPSLEFVSAAAKALGVSVDALITYDYTKMSPTQEYLAAFIDRITQQTNKLELLWSQDSLPLNNHPLYMLEGRETGETDENGYPEYENEYVFSSRFYDNAAELVRDFYVDLDDKTRLYICYVRVSFVFGKTDDGDFEYDDEAAFEMYMTQGGSVSEICCSHTAYGFDDALMALCSAADNSTRTPKISKTVRSAIDEYMNANKTEDKDN